MLDRLFPCPARLLDVPELLRKWPELAKLFQQMIKGAYQEALVTGLLGGASIGIALGGLLGMAVGAWIATRKRQ